MTRVSYILLPRTTEWRIGVIRADGPIWIDVPIAPQAASAQIASAVFAALNGAGYAGEGTILAIPSSWCMAASIDIGDLPKNDRKAMLFRLEEKLPIAAESLVADFLSTDPGRSRPLAGQASAAGKIQKEAAPPSRSIGSAKVNPREDAVGPPESTGHALGVCARIADLQKIVEALEGAGIAVASITPAALLALQALATRNETVAGIMLLAEPADAPDLQINVFNIEAGRPRTWELLGAQARDVKLSLELIALERGELPSLAAWGVESAALNSIAAAIGQPIAVGEGSADEAMARFAAEILAGKQRPWVEFRRGALAIADPIATHRRSLNLLLASAAALALACAGAMFVRGALYQRAADSREQQMQQAFHAQFPGWATPPNVRAVVASEHRKAAGNVGAALPMESNRSALQTLHDVLGKLPSAGDFSIDRMTLEDSAFEIQGRLRSYEEIDAIASAARKAGMETPPPQARKDADGFWSFTLRGELPQKPVAAMAKGGSP